MGLNQTGTSKSTTVLKENPRVGEYRILNQYAIKGETVLTGSSLMELFPIHELLTDRRMHKTVYNRGICGYVIQELLDSLEVCVLELKPSKLFINIGSNDIGTPGYSLERLLGQYHTLLDQVENALPKCAIHLLAYYPVRDNGDIETTSPGAFDTRNNSNIRKANEALELLAKERSIQFLNLNEGLTDADGLLKKEFTADGIHMYANGYRIVLDHLIQYL